MKTTDMTSREIAVAKRAAADYLAKVRSGMAYDVVKLAWVKREELTLKQS